MPDQPPAASTARPTATDAADMLRRCAGGDRGAFRMLYDQWGARLYGIALRITGQPALAADATHDAFVQVWQRADRFDPERGGAEAFLVSLVRYRALDIVRRRGREVLSSDPPDQEDESPDALSRLVTTAEGTALHRCLNGLDPDRRRLVLMAFAEGLSHGELSVRLSVPLGTIKSWIRRSLLSLRECLAS